jgi:PKHD-type hydroxylase
MEQLTYYSSSSANIIRTKLPQELIDVALQAIENDELISHKELQQGTTQKGAQNLRNSVISFTPNHHWIVGFMWYYLSQCNMYNFMYDIETFDNSSLQYTVYTEGMYYGWHTDDTQANVASMVHPRFRSHQAPIKEYVRKLSFSLQLSHPDEYEGGELQLYTNKAVQTVPKELGSIVVFDSRINHRVRKVKSGTRKSLVGWAIGPRWK